MLNKASHLQDIMYSVILFVFFWLGGTNQLQYTFIGA